MLIRAHMEVDPVFHPPSDLLGIQEAFYNHGIAFLEGFDEQSLSKLASQFGDIIRPRNETTSGTGISNIRFEPSLVGKGYSSEGIISQCLFKVQGIQADNLSTPRVILPH
jgi:hypothetical protein